MEGLELIGTQKQQVMQLPRIPKFNVKGRRASPRGLSLNYPKANFMIPHYNYFYAPVGFQPVTPDTLGETMTPGQMHQLITLDNGQMMIRRIDVDYTANNQINISFDGGQNGNQYNQLI